jgi:hypothetical protein
MYHITKEQYNGIHKDYRGVWSNEDDPELIGLRTCIEASLQRAAGYQVTPGPATLIFEGHHFLIKGE